jgi:hypothetical protein
VENLNVTSNNFLTLSGGTISARTAAINGTLEGQGTLGTSHPGFSDTAQFNTGCTVKPTSAINCANIVLPATMNVDATNLVGTALISYTGTASGSTDLSGWTITNGPAGYFAKLDTNLKQVKLAPPNKNLRMSGGKIFVRGGRVLMSQ